jgi:hypothetical protein
MGAEDIEDLDTELDAGAGLGLNKDLADKLRQFEAMQVRGRRDAANTVREIWG